jgi:hypothetical protein
MLTNFSWKTRGDKLSDLDTDNSKSEVKLPEFKCGPTMRTYGAVDL